jgi:hypothetical protein
MEHQYLTGLWLIVHHLHCHRECEWVNHLFNDVHLYKQYDTAFQHPAWAHDFDGIIQRYCGERYASTDNGGREQSG